MAVINGVEVSLFLDNSEVRFSKNLITNWWS